LFEKELTKPLELQQHEVLLERIPEDHSMRPEVERKRGKLNGGYNGEKTLHYFLGLLPQKSYHIFHGIRLPVGTTYFEIDAFLYSSKFGFIIENKNYSGNIRLEKNQLTQEIPDTNTRNVYENPLDQVHRHKVLLTNWFQKHQIPIIPFEQLVTFSNTSSIINISPGYLEAEKRVCKANDILRKINEFEKFYKRDLIDQKVMGKIRRLILNQHIQKGIDILQTYGIDKNEIITGVLCPQCRFIPMEYERGKWKCPSCHLISKDAHLKAINDYFLIINSMITNAELREFLHLPSARTATYLLSNLNFPHDGVNRGRVYFNPKG